MNEVEVKEFQAELTMFYTKHGRHDLPWRLPESDSSFDPYKIMVSELMLQQTQVPRVIPKYQAFLHEFPTLEALASAPLAQVLKAWQGLGYNRRAKFLHQAAQKTVAEFGGHMPISPELLVALPGIGKNTAGAIMAYAYNEHVVFIETNIRSVYLHHFFKDQTDVPDATIVALVAQTLDHQNPRQFYWSLMDYGSYLKKTLPNPSRRSHSHSVQSKFEGSRRQVRGQVLRLLANDSLTTAELTAAITDERLSSVLEDLAQEGLIEQRGGRLYLAGDN